MFYRVQVMEIISIFKAEERLCTETASSDIYSTCFETFLLVPFLFLFRNVLSFESTEFTVIETSFASPLFI